MIRRRRSRQILFSLLVVAAMALAAGPAAGAAPAAAAATVHTPSLSTSDRLPLRRFVAAGTRAYEVGTEDARYPVMGFHTRGEMGGFWSPPVKLLDGLWFGVNGSWVGPATTFTRNAGSVSFDLPDTGGVSLQRTDLAPDGKRAVLVGIRLSSPESRTVHLTVAAHSELMGVYPWGETTPSQLAVNGQDAVSGTGGRLSFTDALHPYGAVVGAASLTPDSIATGPTSADRRNRPRSARPPGPAPPRHRTAATTRRTAGASAVR